MANYKDIKYQFPTSAVTSGTFADGRISESSVTQHASATDLQPIKSDITALALREATNEASAAFNLPNQFIETFTDDTNLGTQTDGMLGTGYWGSIGSAGYTFTSDSNTSLLIHSNATNGSTTFADSSSGNHTVTVRSGTTHSTTKSKFGSSSILNTRATGITFPDHADFDFGTGAFTIEAWINVAAATADTMYIFGKVGGTNTDCRLGISATTGTAWVDEQVSNTDANIYSTNSVCDGEWHHIAVSRTSGGTTNMWIDGADNKTGGTNRNCDNSAALGIGCNSANTLGAVVGYIDEVRVSKGVARYTTSTFTPPAAETTTNATGTLIQSANAVASNKTKVGGTMLYKDNAGTATLGSANDLAIYFTCNGGTNWTEAASYNAITPVYSTGIKQVRLGETTCTQGTDVRYKAVWANQASGSKETQLHGIGINY
jgi:hypothetical protein